MVPFKALIFRRRFELITQSVFRKLAQVVRVQFGWEHSVMNVGSLLQVNHFNYLHDLEFLRKFCLFLHTRSATSFIVVKTLFGGKILSGNSKYYMWC